MNPNVGKRLKPTWPAQMRRNCKRETRNMINGNAIPTIKKIKFNAYRES